MIRRSGLRSISDKRKASVKTRANSTFAILPSTADRLRASDLSRFSTLERKTPIAKRNRERQVKKDRAYQAALRRYRASETWKIVEARCQKRCEFAVLDATGFDDRPRVVDIRIDRELPPGYRRCGKRRRDHHHTTYARLGGDELPEDVLAGCPGCHEYVEATKAVHRHKRQASA